MGGAGSRFDRAIADLVRLAGADHLRREAVHRGHGQGPFVQRLLSDSREAMADLDADLADDPASIPCVAIAQPEQAGWPAPEPVYLRPPSRPAVAAFVFASPWGLKERDLAAWVSVGDLERLTALSDATEQLAALVLHHGRRPLGRQRELYATRRGLVVDALRQGLAERLGQRLTFSQERTFAYLAGLVAASSLAKSTAPRGYRVCEVCARVFASPRRSKCPTNCRAHKLAERRTPDDASEGFFWRRVSR